MNARATLVVVLILLPWAVASGHPQFFAGFRREYAHSKTPQRWQRVVAQAKCAICHQGEPDEGGEARNRYGAYLGRYLGEQHKSDRDRIRRALIAIEDEWSSDHPQVIETYGNRLKAYQLPSRNEN